MEKQAPSSPLDALEKKGFNPWYLVLLLPLIATLWPPFYTFQKPELWGIPFFYWYQFLWIPASAVCTGVVYFATRS